MQSHPTYFASLASWEKGRAEIISGSVKHYVFSNMFDVASRARPYEKVVVGKNLEYVLEALRAEGASPWFACAHDEFAVCMDGEVEVQFVKLEAAPAKGRRMGLVRLKRGHQALLPAGAADEITWDVQELRAAALQRLRRAAAVRAPLLVLPLLGRCLRARPR